MKVNETDIKNLSDEKLKNLFIEKGYGFIWHQSLDAVEIGRLADTRFTREKLIEARIFGNNKEMHIFFYDDDFIAIECVGEDSDLNVGSLDNIPKDREHIHYFDEIQLLPEKYGKTITFRNFIEYEEDGQAYIGNKIILRYE